LTWCGRDLKCPGMFVTKEGVSLGNGHIRILLRKVRGGREFMGEALKFLSVSKGGAKRCLSAL